MFQPCLIKHEQTIIAALNYTHYRCTNLQANKWKSLLYISRLKFSRKGHGSAFDAFAYKLSSLQVLQPTQK